MLPHTSLPNTTFMRTSEEARLPDMKADRDQYRTETATAPYSAVKKAVFGRRSTSANMKKHFLFEDKEGCIRYYL